MLKTTVAVVIALHITIFMTFDDENVSKKSFKKKSMSQSRFSVLTASAPIEVFALTVAYNEDTFDRKVNLGVGGQRLRVMVNTAIKLFICLVMILGRWVFI